MSSPNAADPVLSVVVTLTTGRIDTLRACLESLAGQAGGPALEVLVPFDDAAAAVAEAGPAFPGARFLRVPGVDGTTARLGRSREAHDLLRSAGIAAARGALVALVEDHARLEPGWAAALERELREHPGAGAAGGAVECGSGRAANAAAWWCDFGRYGRPFAAGPAEAVSDTNVAYRREALDRVRDAWTPAYHEPRVHAALRAAGFAIRLTPEAVASQCRPPLRICPTFRERIVWGRSFGAARARTWPAPKRFALALLCVFLPVLLTARRLREAMARGWLLRMLPAVPMMFLLNLGWALGEAAGTWTGRAEPRSR